MIISLLPRDKGETCDSYNRVVIALLFTLNEQLSYFELEPETHNLVLILITIKRQ